MSTDRFPAVHTMVSKGALHAARSKRTSRGDSGEIISSLVPGDLLEGARHFDLDQSTFFSLRRSLRLDPTNLGGLFVPFGVSGVVGRGGFESGEGELLRADREKVGEEGEW